jgi:hypothetical protein
MNIKFRLNEFRAIAKWLDKKLSKPLAFFIKGWLYGLETAWVAAKASAAVEKGVTPVKPLDPVVAPPRRHTEPSTVEGLDEIGFTYEFVERPQASSSSSRSDS